MGGGVFFLVPIGPVGNEVRLCVWGGGEGEGTWKNSLKFQILKAKFKQLLGVLSTKHSFLK